MARFILDVANCDKNDIEKVFEILDRDKFLSLKIATIKCIDETNDNQFYTEYEDNTNELSEEQINNFKKICND